MGEGLQISRGERVPESIAFSAGGLFAGSSQFSTIAVAASGVSSYGQPEFTALRDNYVNGICISVAGSTNNESVTEKTYIIRLSRTANQQGALSSDILIPVSSVQGLVSPIPLFCDIYGVAIHAVSNSIGTNTNLVSCLFF